MFLRAACLLRGFALFTIAFSFEVSLSFDFAFVSFSTFGRLFRSMATYFIQGVQYYPGLPRSPRPSSFDHFACDQMEVPYLIYYLLLLFYN